MLCDNNDYRWMTTIVQLFNDLYGGDYLHYVYQKERGCRVQEIDDPTYQYNHDIWEENYSKAIEGVSSPKKKVPVSKRCQLYQKELDANSTSDADQSGCTSLPSTPQKPLNVAPTVVPPQVVTQYAIQTFTMLTRKEFAMTQIPPISKSLHCQIKGIFGTFHPQDATYLRERPSESTVNKAYVELRKRRNATGIEIGALGQFNRDGLSIMRKYCEISSIKNEILEEETWLDGPNDSLSRSDIKEIKDVLWNKSSTETILRAGHKSIDVSSLSTLVGERYLDNFVIDTVITKITQEISTSTVLFIPPEAHDWLKTNDDEYIKSKLSISMNSVTIHTVKFMLLPLQMSGCHWGLIAADFDNEDIYFDDGMKFKPGRVVLPNVKKLLHLIHQLTPALPPLNNVQDFKRIGMP